MVIGILQVNVQGPYFVVPLARQNHNLSLKKKINPTDPSE